MSSVSLNPDWFPDEDFRFRFGTLPGNVEEFFALSPEAAGVLAERRDWLKSDPARYAAILPDGLAIAEELLTVASGWPAVKGATNELQDSSGNLLDRFMLLSELVEPDLVLLAPRADGRCIVAGGCVCFPSSWRLTDKLGQTIGEVHQPVPGLNLSLEILLDRLLSYLRPGRSVVRANWSVCGQPELNQHLDRNLPGIPIPVTLDRTWLRREDQCLFVLPQTGGIVFGIRVTHVSWRDLQDSRHAAISVARSLRTMPREMLEYKRLEAVSEALARLLEPATDEQAAEQKAPSQVDSREHR